MEKPHKSQVHQLSNLCPFLLLALVFLLRFQTTSACFGTAATGLPGGGGTGCCPPLTQTVTNNTQFADGVMTFTYDSNICRTTVLATCSQPNPALNLNAAIVANTNNFLSVGSMTTSFPGVCDVNNQWNMGNPPLIIQTLECLLTNPNGG